MTWRLVEPLASMEHLPQPLEGEGIVEYARRLGIPAPERLVEGLDERTIDCAEMRLSHLIRLESPRAWWEAADRLMEHRIEHWRELREAA